MSEEKILKILDKEDNLEQKYFTLYRVISKLLEKGSIFDKEKHFALLRQILLWLLDNNLKPIEVITFLGKCGESYIELHPEIAQLLSEIAKATNNSRSYTA